MSPAALLINTSLPSDLIKSYQTKQQISPMATSSSSSSRKSTRRRNGSFPTQCLKYSKRATLHSVVGRHDGGLGLAGERAVVGGWVKSCSDVAKVKRAGPASPSRKPAEETTSLTCTEVLMSRVPLIRCIARLIAGGVTAAASSGSGRIAEGTAVVRINDGSCLADLQVVVDSSCCPLEEVTVVGTCVLVEGKIEQVESTGQHHIVQLRVEKVLHIGAVDSKARPLSNAHLSSDFFRDYRQLAARTPAAASTARVRSEAVHAAHAFFRSSGFFHVNTPIMTTTVAGDCSKMLRVAHLASKPDDNRITPQVVRAAIKVKAKQVEALKRSESNKEALESAEQDLQKANELAEQLEQGENTGFSSGILHRPTYLSPCHTLHLEMYACALSSVYTFGPVFKADETLEHGRRLSERWTIDAELAFSELEEAISCAEDCLKFIFSAVSKHCSDDMKFLLSRPDHATNGHDDESAMSAPWLRISYTEAVRTLLQAPEKSFEAKVEWGMPLSDEHLSYLADDSYKKPVIIYGYPKQLKPFYARLQEDGKTVSAFDIVVPKVGVVACGSQKEERLDKLTSRIDELRLPHEQMEWYLDTRMNGTVKHSGFSIDLERLILSVTGLRGVRDEIPFPRITGDAKC